MGDWLSGACLGVAALAALRKADRDGRGERVDVSKLEAMTPTLTNAGSLWGFFSDVWHLPSSEDVPSIEPTDEPAPDEPREAGQELFRAAFGPEVSFPFYSGKRLPEEPTAKGSASWRSGSQPGDSAAGPRAGRCARARQ